MRPPDIDIETLFAEHGSVIFRLCYRLCGDRTRAEDLAQDAFVIALRSKDRFRHAANPKTWLYGIAVNLIRKNRRRQALERAFRAATPKGDSPEGLIDLERAIDALPPRLREPFVLAKVERLTSAEVGAVLDLPEGTVRARIHEAVGLLRLRLAPDSCLHEDTSYAL